MLRVAWARSFPVLVLVPAVIVALIACPAYRDYRERHDLDQATAAVASRLARAKAGAVATGEVQIVRLVASPPGRTASRGSRASAPAWRPPRGVTYLWAPGTCDTFRMTTDGRCADAGMVILRDRKGRRDSVTVRYSGLILAP